MIPYTTVRTGYKTLKTYNFVGENLSWNQSNVSEGFVEEISQGIPSTMVGF